MGWFTLTRDGRLYEIDEVRADQLGGARGQPGRALRRASRRLGGFVHRRQTARLQPIGQWMNVLAGMGLLLCWLRSWSDRAFC